MKYEDVTLEIGRWSAEEKVALGTDTKCFRVRFHGRGVTADGSFTIPQLQMPDTDLEGIGRALFAAVFADLEPRDLFLRCWAHVEGRNEAVEPGDEAALRIRLILDLEGADFAAINALPWELLSPPTTSFLVFCRSTSLVRAPNRGEPVRRRRLPEMLRVLVVMPDPKDPSLGPLDLESEWENLRKACAGLERRIRLERLDSKSSLLPTTRGALRRALLDAHRQRQPFHVVHFMGHGAFDDVRNQGWLVFENREGGPEYVSGDELAREMADFLPQLVVLNACDTAAAFGYLGGVAHRLLMKGLPVVVGMQRRISDPAAIAFATELYRALAAGDPVDAAMTEARLEIDRQKGPSRKQWWVPVLFLRDTDGRLFEVNREHLVASLIPDTVTWTQQVEEVRQQVAAYTDMPPHSVRIVGSPADSRIKIELPESRAREVLSGWRRGESPLRGLPIRNLQRPWERRWVGFACFLGLPLAVAVWDGFLFPRSRWIDQLNGVITIDAPGEPLQSLLYYLSIGALVLLAWALQRRFLPSLAFRQSEFWLVGLVLLMVIGYGFRPPPGVEASTYLEGRLDTGQASYAYLFVRPIEGGTCWLQGQCPLMIGWGGRWRTRASFGGSRGQRYEVIALASEEPLHPQPFSDPDAYACEQLSPLAHRTVRLVVRR